MSSDLARDGAPVIRLVPGLDVAVPPAPRVSVGIRPERAPLLVTDEEGYQPSADDVLRPAMWLGTRMIVVGFACGVVYSVGGLISDALTTGLNEGTALAFGALIGMPVLFGVAGFAAGAAAGGTVVVVRVVIGE